MASSLLFSFSLTQTLSPTPPAYSSFARIYLIFYCLCLCLSLSLTLTLLPTLHSDLGEAIVCTLIPGKVVNFQLSLEICEPTYFQLSLIGGGKKVGKGRVFLSGNVRPFDDFDGDFGDEDDLSEGDMSISNEEEDDEEDMEEEVAMEEKPSTKSKRKTPPSEEKPSTPKKKEKETPKKKEKEVKKAETPAKETKEKKEKKEKKKKNKMVSLSSGLKYQDTEIGTGVPVKKGAKLSMRYRGVLENGREFDSNMPRGNPFSFRLGKGEVIKGWDEGILGMRVGGKRMLVIPANLGYGRRGAPPDIPGNATLYFEVHVLKQH